LGSCDELYITLLAGDAQLHGRTTIVPIGVQGHSLKTSFVTVPVAHDLKQWLRFFAFDIISLVKPGGRARDSFRAAMLKIAGSKTFYDFFYTKSAYHLFLDRTDHSIQLWESLPGIVQLLVSFLGIIANQAVCRDVSNFHIATFAAATFLCNPLGRSHSQKWDLT
jgi:hypothetical protein